MVGVIAAQSIGEPTSQMTLNTKHFAGQAGKGSSNMGVSRIKEIISYGKNIQTPQMMIYFDKKYNKNKKSVNKINSYLKHLTIEELIDSAEIIYNVKGDDDISNIIKDDNVKNPFFINDQNTDESNLPFIFRFKLNIEKMMDKETTLLDIKTKFITYWYKNFSNLKNLKRNIKDIVSKIDELAILNNNDNVIHIKFKMNDFNYNILTSFFKIILKTITLKGIDNIDDTGMSQEMLVSFDENGNKQVEKEYVVITSGINISELKYIKGIDFARTRVNDIYQTHKHYGIEACFQIIINELLFTFNAGGSGGINYSHLALLVDFMTHPGEIISIDRFGLNKLNIDPMARASFEKTMEHFVNAAIFNDVDKLNSVSSRVMVGRVIQGGTGCFDLLLDTEKLINSEYIEDETGGRTTFKPLDIDPLFEDIMTNDLNKIDFYIPKL